MIDVPRKCPDCGGEGGWYVQDRYPPTWTFCTECFGLGWRSAAADRFFGRAAPTYASPLER